MPNWNDDNGANEFDDQLEDADSTAILVGMLSELKQIRWELQHLNDQLGASGEEPAYFACAFCDDEVPGEDRRDHLESAHNAPEGLALGEAFTAVSSRD